MHKELLDAVGVFKKKKPWYETVSGIISLIISGVTVIVLATSPLTDIWDRFDKVEKENDLIIHYIREKHPETREENGGYLENPFSTREILGQSNIINGLYVPCELDHHTIGGSE